MNGTVWCVVVFVQIWFVRTASLMDGSVDTKMWLIFIVVEDVTERVELMWTGGLEYTHVSFVRAVSCKQSSSSSYKSYNIHVNITVYKLHYYKQHYCRSFTKLRLWLTASWREVNVKRFRVDMTELWRVAALFTSEKERWQERERETVPFGSATPSKPSHRLLHITERRQWMFIVKTKEK